MGSSIVVLSKAIQGDFAGLIDGDGDGLDEAARKDLARGRLIELVDGEIAALESHYETLDFETIDLDRLGAGDRALFDPSKEASLARRYESEARRGFFKALKEFRQAEAVATDRAEAAPAPSPAAPIPTPEVARPREPLGSSRVEPSPAVRDPQPAPNPDEAPRIKPPLRPRRPAHPANRGRRHRGMSRPAADSRAFSDPLPRKGWPTVTFPGRWASAAALSYSPLPPGEGPPHVSRGPNPSVPGRRGSYHDPHPSPLPEGEGARKARQFEGGFEKRRSVSRKVGGGPYAGGSRH